MKLLIPPDTGPAIARFIERLDAMQRGADEETDGWLIRRPTLTETDEHFGILVAQSKANSSEPLILPTGLELCIGVIAGAIRIDGHCGEFSAGHFFVVRPKDGRTVRSVYHPTRVSVQFFRGTNDDGSALDLQRIA